MISLSGPCQLLFYLPLGCCGECDVISLYFMCCSVDGFVCLVCCVFDGVCELFHQTIYVWCGCYFVVLECYGSF